MSNRDLFIASYLEKIQKRYRIDSSQAFEVFSIAAILEMTFDEVYNTILIKGSRDGGIDGIYFEKEGMSCTMHVFQCKNSPGLKANSIDKFRNDVRDIFNEGNKANRQHIEDLQPMIDEYKQLSAEGYIVDSRLYFLYSGLNDDPDHSGNNLAFTTYHQPDNFEIWDANAIYQRILSLMQAQNRRKDVRFVFHPESSNISLRDSQGLYSYSILNVRAVNFRIKAVELCNLVQQEKDVNSTDEHLFAQNIRSYLGMRTRANKNMSATLDNPEEAFYFPFLNNGITIICKRLTVPTSQQDGQYLIPVINPVIVNGLQTTRVLFDKYQKDRRKLDNVFLNIRLYETDDIVLIDKITDATNTQTPITFSDKLSNKNFNQIAKDLFENHGIAYLTKRGEIFSNQFSVDAGESVKSETVLKYWYATFYERPDIAKNSIASVLEEIYDATNNDSLLQQLFTGDKDSPIYSQLLHAYNIYKFVQSQKDIYLHQKEFVAHADELLSYGIYKLLENSLDNTTNTARLQEAYTYAFQLIDTIVSHDIEQHEKDNKLFSFSGYFKRPKCKVDYNNKAGIIESDNLLLLLLRKH